VRYAPFIFYTGALIALYFLVRSITKSRAKGIFSAFLYGTSSVGYIIHAEESGMVRGLALLFTLVGLAAFHSAFTNSKKIWPVLIGSLCLVCTALTTFTYLVFFLISILVLFLFSKERFSRRFMIAFLMCFIAALLTAPWLITMFNRYGITPFLNASGTHGGITTFLRFRTIPFFINELLNVFQEGKINVSTGASGLVLLGLCYMLFKNKWILPVWFLAVILFVGEAERFLFIVGTALAAEATIDFFNSMEMGFYTRRISQLAMHIFPILLLLSFFGGNFFRMMINLKSLDIPDMTTLSNWFQKNTSEKASYLLISISSAYGYTENMPFFIERTPVILPWGSEWTDSYNIQRTMSSDLDDCILQESFTCVYSLLEQMNLSPDYLITYNEDTKLTQDIRDGSIWREVYINPTFVVYKN
jgi:hypothetical protein